MTVITPLHSVAKLYLRVHVHVDTKYPLLIELLRFRSSLWLAKVQG